MISSFLTSLKLIWLLALASIAGFALNALELNFEHVYSVTEARSNIPLDTIEVCNFYILNGIPFNKEDFKVELGSYKLSDLKFSKVFNTSNTTFFHQNCDYVIVVGAGKYEQAKEEKLRELDSIRANLNRNLPNLIIRDYISSDCKQVTVDGRPLWVYDAKDLVNNLKVEEIDFIMSYEYANPEAFGRNAKNGLIEIFLTKKAAKRRSKNSKRRIISSLWPSASSVVIKPQSQQRNTENNQKVIKNN